MEVSGRKDSHLKTKQLCQPCVNDGDSVPAEGYCETCKEYLCSVCLKVHRKQSATKNHVIKSKDDMPTGHVQTDPCSEPCRKHKTEIVKFYCKHHDEVGCGDCMILEHKACKVQLVPDASGNYGNSEELHKIKQKIERLQKEISTCKSDVEYNLKAADKINTKVVEEIRKFREDINTYLDNVESELLKETDQLLSNDVSLQSKLQEECDSIQREIKQFQSELNINSEKINKLFVSAKLAQKRLHEFQQSAERIASESQITSYTFQASKDIKVLKTTNTSLGTLSLEIKKLSGKRRMNVADMKAEFVTSLNIEVAKEHTCDITGLAKISSDEILLADYGNASLKILNIKRNKITSKYSCSCGKPWDVTVINATTAAATVLYDKILFLNIENGLSERQSVKVRNNCRGIDYCNGIFAVCFCWPSAVHILNLKGEVLHEANDTSMFGYLGHIAFGNDTSTVYVSDNDNCAVHELTINGQLKATIKCDANSDLRGLAVTHNGTVIVCCEYNRLSMILPTTREMRSLKVKHVQNPFAILLHEEQKRLYICSSGSNETKMFDLK